MKPIVHIAPLVAVTSSQLNAVGYDQVSRTLQINFNNKPDTTYQYHDVPPEVFDNFIAQQRRKDGGDNTASVGHVFYGEVKNKFDYTRFEKDGDHWVPTKSGQRKAPDSAPSSTEAQAA